MLEHQLRVGGLKNGDRAYLKLGGDGTNITKKDCCTVHSITLSSEDRALQISTVAVVMGGETYEVDSFDNVFRADHDGLFIHELLFSA